MLCPCRAGAELCQLCREGLYAQLRGAAACRGERWATDLAAAGVGRGLAWPEGSDKMLAIARLKVADLTRDRQLLELLAVELAAWAARRWAIS